MTPVPDPCDTPPRKGVIRRELDTHTIVVNQQLRHHPRA